MVSFEQISAYTNSLLDLCPDKTDCFYFDLVEKGHPVIKRDVAKFLSQIIMLKQPDKVLEIGTNVGYSAIIMAKHLKNGKIYSIDYRADNHEAARNNFIKFGVGEKIELLTGYGQEILKDLNDKFDLIFIDADKKGYGDYLDFALEHLNPGGIIIADNLFWKGAVIEPDEKNDERNITASLIEFNKKFAKLEGFNTQILSIGDGLGFAIKDE
jgi:predicted O-methyltransferase YrrM